MVLCDILLVQKGCESEHGPFFAHEMLCDQTWIKKSWESEHGVSLHRESCVTQPDSRKAVNVNIWLRVIVEGVGWLY